VSSHEVVSILFSFDDCCFIIDSQKSGGKVVLGEGTVFGLNILLGKAHKMYGWPWMYGQVSEDGKVVENR
jgi:hypothetical protein